MDVDRCVTKVVPLARCSRRSVVVLSLSFTGNEADAQSTSEYAHQVDSLAHIWQVATTTVAARAAAANAMPASTIHVGPINVHADSQWTELARTVTEKLAPAVSHAYGKFSWRLTRVSVRSARQRRNRGSHLRCLRDCRLDWSRTVAWIRLLDLSRPLRVMATEGRVGHRGRDGSKRSIVDTGGHSHRRTDAGNVVRGARLVNSVADSPASADCVHGRIDRCVQILGLVEVADPAFALFNAASRVSVIERWSPLCCAEPIQKQYDRCTVAKVEAACDFRSLCEPCRRM